LGVVWSEKSSSWWAGVTGAGLPEIAFLAREDILRLA